MELILRFLLFLYKSKYIPTGMQFSILLLLMLNIKNTVTYEIYFKNVNFRQCVKISNCSPKEAKFYYSPSLQSSRNRVVLVGRNTCPGSNTPHVQFALKLFYKIPGSTEHTLIKSTLAKLQLCSYRTVCEEPQPHCFSR